MSFEWPMALWLLLAVPGLVAAYLWLKRRRKKIALRYASLAVVREALGRAPGWRRHVPPVLLLIAITALIVAAARPGARITLPSDHRTIVLAIDVSLSMRANDIEPSRIAAAQAAAKQFVQAQPNDVRVALVSFAGSAAVVQPPTRSRDELVAAIDRLELQRHTGDRQRHPDLAADDLPRAGRGADGRQRARRHGARVRAIAGQVARREAGAGQEAFHPCPRARTRARRSSC
jgi:Ca-activated chloride channel family protein